MSVKNLQYVAELTVLYGFIDIDILNKMQYYKIWKETWFSYINWGSVAKWKEKSITE